MPLSCYHGHPITMATLGVQSNLCDPLVTVLMGFQCILHNLILILSAYFYNLIMQFKKLVWTGTYFVRGIINSQEIKENYRKKFWLISQQPWAHRHDKVQFSPYCVTVNGNLFCVSRFNIVHPSVPCLGEKGKSTGCFSLWVISVKFEWQGLFHPA